MPFRLLVSVVFASLCAAGCSTKMAYFSAQEMQRAQCDKQTDLHALQRCRAEVQPSYEDYQRQVEAVKPAQ